MACQKNVISTKISVKAEKLVVDCYHCDEKFTNEDDLFEHEKIHIIERIKERRKWCEFCPEKFKTIKAKKDHEKVHYVIQCEKCDEKFPTEWESKDHFQSVHFIEEWRKFVATQSFDCEHCGQKCHNEYALKKHKKIHSMVQCQFCDEKFENRRLTKFHEKNHTGEERFICQLCKREFVNQTNLENHTKNVQCMIRKKPECQFCGKKFERVMSKKHHESLKKCSAPDLKTFAEKKKMNLA